MIQEQQQQTNQWVLTPVQFNLVIPLKLTTNHYHKKQNCFYIPKIGSFYMQNGTDIQKSLIFVFSTFLQLRASEVF